MAKKRAMSSVKASRVKIQGHKREKIFANLIGLSDEYKHDRKAKKDVIDFNGDAHSVKGGKYWQIFLYSRNRMEEDYGFKVMNGMGQLIADCLDVFPENRNEYEKKKQKYKDLLQEPMQKLCKKLQDKDRLKAFLSKAIFNGGEVQYLSIFEYKSDEIFIFYYKDVVEALANKFIVENSTARSKGQTPNQKVLFKYRINVGEIEVRNESDKHYRQIKFRLNSSLALEILKEVITTSYKPPVINGVTNTRITLYGEAIKKFK